MLAHERDFLIAEYEQAWAMIRAFDERRLRFIEYYSAIFATIVAASSLLLSWRDAIDLYVVVPVSALLVAGVATGLAFLWSLSSERSANIRYRKKVNLIRGIFLERGDRGTEPRIDDYLAHKELGILVGTDNQPFGVGRTLRGIIFFLVLLTSLMLGGIAAIWLAFSVA